VIRTTWVALNLLVGTTIMSSWVILASLVRSEPMVYHRIGQRWSRWVLWASGVRVRTEGLEDVHLEEPQLFLCNHVSWYDVWAIAATLPKRYRYIAKKELEWVPIFGRAWRTAGHISIDRSDRRAAVAAIDAAGDAIRQDNSSIVIFPEGTRSVTGELQPFKKGAFMLALHTHVDIVPMAVLGSRHVLPKGKWRVRGGEIILRFGPAIPTVGYNESNRDELIRRVRAAIERLLAAPVQRKASDNGGNR
jgi:1-acyl-sn-glycerol-3-phosphate acyltransferase